MDFSDLKLFGAVSTAGSCIGIAIITLITLPVAVATLPMIAVLYGSGRAIGFVTNKIKKKNKNQRLRSANKTNK